MQDEAATLHFQKSKNEFERLFPSTGTLEAQVLRQVDKDGFAIAAEQLSEVELPSDWCNIVCLRNVNGQPGQCVVRKKNSIPLIFLLSS